MMDLSVAWMHESSLKTIEACKEAYKLMRIVYFNFVCIGRRHPDVCGQRI